MNAPTHCGKMMVAATSDKGSPVWACLTCARMEPRGGELAAKTQTNGREVKSEPILRQSARKQSQGEILFPDVLRDYGSDLPTPAEQFKLLGRTFDFYFVREGLAIEIIGGAHRASMEQLSRDCERDNELMMTGTRVLKFTPDMLRKSPSECVALIRSALKQMGWRAAA